MSVLFHIFKHRIDKKMTTTSASEMQDLIEFLVKNREKDTLHKLLVDAEVNIKTKVLIARYIVADANEWTDITLLPLARNIIRRYIVSWSLDL